MVEQQQTIAGQLVEMTPGAVERWNSGCPTDYDLRRSRVWVGAPALDGTGKWITLRRATNERLEPELAGILQYQPVFVEVWETTVLGGE
jgi:hypothetical protein